MQAGLSNDDIAIEVLTRLPIDSLVGLKCVCKRWLHLISDPSFRIAHSQRNKRVISGLFIQSMFYCCGPYEDDDELIGGVVVYSELGSGEHCVLRKTVLDFLPEKVALAASYDGLLICRNLSAREIKESRMCFPDDDEKKDNRNKLVVYVCNPCTKEWTSLILDVGQDDWSNIWLACNLSSSSSSVSFLSLASFKVVIIVRSVGESKKTAPYYYTFKIYSSKDSIWRTSGEVCVCSDRVRKFRAAFVNGVFYWLTDGHSIISFTLEYEQSQVIKLPEPVLKLEYLKMEYLDCICLGESDGYLHYICLIENGLEVWVLKYDDDSEPSWELKYSHLFCEMKHPTMTIDCFYDTSSEAKPFAFDEDDIIYIGFEWNICRYYCKERRIEELCTCYDIANCGFPTPIVLPYCKTLAPVYTNMPAGEGVSN